MSSSGGTHSPTTEASIRAAQDTALDARLDAAEAAIGGFPSPPHAALPTLRNTSVVVVQDEAPPTPQRFGAVGDGVADDTDALNDLLAGGYSEVYIPPGTYAVSSKITQPDCSVRLSEQATIKATAPMATMWEVGTVAAAANRKVLVGGIFDGNNLATTPLLLLNFARLSVRDVKVWNAAGDALVLGDPSTAGAPYEPLLENVHIWRPAGSAVPAGSRGLWVRRATDGEYINIQVVGSDIGVQTDIASNRFSHVHTWGYPGHLPSINFYDTNFSNVYANCVADSGSLYGWKFDVSGAVLTGCRILSGADVPPDTMTGIYLATAAKITAIGTEFSGSGVAHAMLTNIGAQTDIFGSAFIGSRSQFVTTVVPDGHYAVPLRATGGVYLGGATTVIGSALWSGSGAPSGALGADGDYFFRQGGTTTRMYFKEGGVWSILDPSRTPMPPTGSYYFPVSPIAASSSGALGNNVFRVAPFIVHNATTIDRIGAEVTVVGEAGSKVRLGIYADNGGGVPGALLLDAGQIAGDSATVQELTCSLALPPGLYWIGAANQSAPTTQPTVKIAASQSSPVHFRAGTGFPAAGFTQAGYSTSGVSGALPASFGSVSAAGFVPRLFVRTT